LAREIADVRPKCIVALGNTPLWALTGETGIVEWRGSQLEGSGGAALIPMLHPAAVLRQYSWHELCIHDIKHRVSVSLNGPVPSSPSAHLVNPEAASVLGWLRECAANQWLAVDLETGGGGILCFGFARSADEALVFDLARYTAQEAHEIDAEMRRALTRCYVVGQSTCAYDAAWFDWKLDFRLRTDFDTYIAQSVLWPGEPRDLRQWCRKRGDAPLEAREVLLHDRWRVASRIQGDEDDPHVLCGCAEGFKGCIELPDRHGTDDRAIREAEKEDARRAVKVLEVHLPAIDILELDAFTALAKGFKPGVRRRGDRQQVRDCKGKRSNEGKREAHSGRSPVQGGPPT
jgi:hypothetical protein